MQEAPGDAESLAAAGSAAGRCLNPHTLLIPPLLLPISPPLAALHHARVALVLAPQDYVAQVPAAESILRDLENRMRREARGWCVHCGSLRLMLKGSVGGEALGVVDASPSKRRKVSKGAKGRAKSAVAGLAGGEAALMGGAGAEVEPRTPPTTSTKNRACSSCGIPYSRPSPLKPRATKPNLPNARSLRRARTKSNAVVEDVFTTPGADPTSSAHASIPAISAKALEPAPALPVQPTPISAPRETPPTSALATPASAASTVRHAPSLRYIPDTDPSPPTYPEPPRTSPPAGSSSSASKSNAAPRKKAKKSGLAKLLAQSKERDAGSGSGSWGLG